MLGLNHNVQSRRTGSIPNETTAKLVGYILTPRSFDSPKDGLMRLQSRGARAGFWLSQMESDVGVATNPFRNGLWRALRRLVCNRCEPQRMPFSMINFEDFMHQSLRPCTCGNTTGDGGIVVERLEHIGSDRVRTSTLVLELAKRGKHVVAEDGICLSCCHPATKKLLGGAS